MNSIRSLVLFLTVIYGLSNSTASAGGSPYENPHIPFIANQGQVDDQIAFYAPTFHGTAFITKNGEIGYSLPCTETNQVLILREVFVGGVMTEVNAGDPLPVKINCFKGQDSSQWRTNIAAYDQVVVGEVYPGIEITLNAYGNNVEKLFRLKPGAAPPDIRILINGADQLAVHDDGRLQANTELGPVFFTKPIAFQVVDDIQVPVEVDYSIMNGCYGFSVGEYDHSLDLIIDPLLASTFLGGSNTDDDYEPALVFAEDGCLYFSGYTYSSDFPTTAGAYDSSYSGGNKDRFVAKFDKDLETLLASTFIGGSGADLGMGLALDQDGDVFIAGYTHSADFPMLPASYDASWNGARDAFVAKLDPDLTTLLGSTYLGGSDAEGKTWPRIDLALTPDGVVWVAGITRSIDFPVSNDAYDKTFNGGGSGGDPFLARFDNDLTTLEAATYLGGSMDEWRVSVTVSHDDHVYICGETESANYPTTAGAYDQSFNGTSDIFISKLPSDLNVLTASTVFGRGAQEEPLAMRLNSLGEVYIAGYTKSANFPTTPGAFSTQFNGGDRDGYVARFDSDLSALLGSTFIGGNGRDDCRDLVLGESGDIYLTGNTASSDFPTLGDSYDTSFNGGSPHGDAFAVRLDSSLTNLKAATYLGGPADDVGFSLALDSEGKIYMGGYTASSNFPVTDQAYDTTFNGGGNDCFIAKFDSLMLASTLVVDKDEMPAGGDTIHFQLDAGADKANRQYIILGGVSGTEPGIPLPGGNTTFHLNWDTYTTVFLNRANTHIFPDFIGITDGNGQATPEFFWPGPSIPPGLVGKTISFAGCLDWPWEFASNSVEIQFVP